MNQPYSSQSNPGAQNYMFISANPQQSAFHVMPVPVTQYQTSYRFSQAPHHSSPGILVPMPEISNGCPLLRNSNFSISQPLQPAFYISGQHVIPRQPAMLGISPYTYLPGMPQNDSIALMNAMQTSSSDMLCTENASQDTLESVVTRIPALSGTEQAHTCVERNESKDAVIHAKLSVLANNGTWTCLLEKAIAGFDDSNESITDEEFQRVQKAYLAMGVKEFCPISLLARTISRDAYNFCSEKDLVDMYCDKTKEGVSDSSKPDFILFEDKYLGYRVAPCFYAMFALVVDNYVDLSDAMKEKYADKARRLITEHLRQKLPSVDFYFTSLDLVNGSMKVVITSGELNLENSNLLDLTRIADSSSDEEGHSPLRFSPGRKITLKLRSHLLQNKRYNKLSDNNTNDSSGYVGEVQQPVSMIPTSNGKEIVFCQDKSPGQRQLPLNLSSETTSEVHESHVTEFSVSLNNIERTTANTTVARQKGNEDNSRPQNKNRFSAKEHGGPVRNSDYEYNEKRHLASRFIKQSQGYGYHGRYSGDVACTTNNSNVNNNRRSSNNHPNSQYHPHNNSCNGAGNHVNGAGRHRGMGSLLFQHGSTSRGGYRNHMRGNGSYIYPSNRRSDSYMNGIGSKTSVSNNANNLDAIRAVTTNISDWPHLADLSTKTSSNHSNNNQQVPHMNGGSSDTPDVRPQKNNVARTIHFSAIENTGPRLSYSQTLKKPNNEVVNHK